MVIKASVSQEGVMVLTVCAADNRTSETGRTDRAERRKDTPMLRDEISCSTLSSSENTRQNISKV